MTNTAEWTQVKTQAKLSQELIEKGQLKVTKEVLNELVRSTGFVNPKTKFAIDADKGIRFEWISNAMEVMRKNRFTSFNYVTDKKS
jgi:biopolymer transport protein ExbD